MTTTTDHATAAPSHAGFTVDWPLHSCDDHLDLPSIPTDLWTSRMRETDPARIPHVEVVDGRTMWVCDGGVLDAFVARPAVQRGLVIPARG